MGQLYFFALSWVIITSDTFVATKCYLVGMRTICRKFISDCFVWAVVALTFSIERSICVRACVSHSFQFLSCGLRTIFTFINLLRETRYGSKCVSLLLLHHILGWNGVRICFKVKSRQTQLFFRFFRCLAIDQLSFIKLFCSLAHGKHKCFQLCLECKVSFLRNLQWSSLRRSQWNTHHATLLKCLLRWSPLGFLYWILSILSILSWCFFPSKSQFHLI